MAPHDELFRRLQDLEELRALVGTSENLHLDCKTWPPKEEDAQRMLAKALCGFANSDGGVIVLGLEARSGASKGDPDLIQGFVPVPDVVYVKSRIEGLVGELVEPRLGSVLVAAIPQAPDSRSGFVVITVPPSEGLPCRSRKHRDFFQRISSGTYPMEYFQVADMFGTRRRPQLSLSVDEGRSRSEGNFHERELKIGIENRGCAIAKFPSIRFNSVPGINVNPRGVDGNRNFGLPRRPTGPELIVFGGGADDVIYPGTVLTVALLDQQEGCRESCY